MVVIEATGEATGDSAEAANLALAPYQKGALKVIVAAIVLAFSKQRLG